MLVSSIAVSAKETINYSDKIQYKSSEIVAADSTKPDFPIPKFTNPEVQKFARQYISYIRTAVAVEKSKDPARIKNFQPKAADFQKRVLKIYEKLKTLPPSEVKKFSDFLQQSAYYYMGRK
ncbi:MAG: hypothetical protein IPJ81_07350 [Chitinophagaceae bacterium]|nr:hypothetical protein [Chitinophagaceae bacterium]